MNTYVLKKIRKIRISTVLVYIFITAAAFVSIFPFIWMILSSFKTFQEINRSIPTFIPETWRAQNYADAWNKPESTFARYYWNTIVISVSGVILQMVVCIPIAYALANLKFRFKNLLFVGILMTMLIPGDISIVPDFMIIRHIPFAGGNNIFGAGGKGFYDSYMGILLPAITSGFTIFLMRQAFMSLPGDYWHSAQIDGLGHWGYLTRILLPLCSATLMTASLLTFIGKWNSLQWPMLVTSSEAMRPLQVGLMYFNSEDGASPQLIMAASTFCIIPILVLYFFTQKQFTEAIVGTGIKG